MSKNETKMTRRYWGRVGETMIEEYRIVPAGQRTFGHRDVDAIIILGGEASDRQPRREDQSRGARCDRRADQGHPSA